MAGKKPAALTPEVRAKLEELLQEPTRSQLTSRTRSAIAAQLRKPLLAQIRANTDEAMAAVGRQHVDIKARIAREVMEGKRQRPRGGIGQAAWDELAESLNKNSDTLKRAYIRYRTRILDRQESARAFQLPMNHPFITGYTAPRRGKGTSLKRRP
jgi:hypothetical protein